MTCRHPLEELQRVYEGRIEPRTDRLLCGLCGEMQYLAARLTSVERDEWTGSYRAGALPSVVPLIASTVTSTDTSTDTSTVTSAVAVPRRSA